MTTRIGFIGCGFIATLHARSVRALIEGGLADARVVAVCDRLPERAEAFAGHLQAAATTDPSDVLDAGAVDAVWVCTPTSSHRALVEQAAAEGIAVFCEKPLAPTLADAEAMARVVEDAGVPDQVGLVMRTAPVFLALRDLVTSGELGPPMAVIFRDDQFFPNQGHYASSWRADVSVAGGGTLIEHSIHDLDLLRFVLGEVDTVTARTANFAGHPGVEDVAVVTLSFASGATASLVSVWHQVLSRPSTRRVEVFCQQGLAWTEDDYTGPLHVETSAGHELKECPAPSWVEGLPIADARWRLYAGEYAVANRAFLDALAEGRRPEPGLAVAVEAHRLANAVYRSAENGGKPVSARC